ncbi:Tyrosinase central domain-containing protein [Colletotrichum higginsianum IMI 349063]|uniref:Tyrosinase central domain-containing protein n=1 Tax=Colletotrichum higginsianum (strain IMI 349063) TaxID=759273 RepID=A0A1B7YPT4_COLHI|nr:Tyrosinase central domain-containing protein [Colletotrichum higginsianum IMI 349063]OBR14041.1 Tyrosinase central domain-containing protein [Colletotrichum higginsianum IMI 349063]GJC95296.1 tyrosinase central domain-containing protein [Colletotrichum higginsianum]
MPGRTETRQVTTRRQPDLDGSDGNPVPHEGLVLAKLWNNVAIVLPPGNGGGCVTRSPFSSMTVRLGPQAMISYGNATTSNSATLMEGNPRCLTRDLNAYPLRRWANSGNMINLIRENSAVEKFQAVAQGGIRGTPRLGSWAGTLLGCLLKRWRRGNIIGCIGPGRT